jgi:CO/xanthine dehydrogenase FAD-binding subunit
VIAVASLALAVDPERDEVRAAYGSAAPTARLVVVPIGESERLPDRVVADCSPIDDVRGTAAYRRHALGVLVRRALERCLS